ncbi:Lysine exporter protein (LYSE/YGGA) [Methanococcus vannielii SB]|uniref:Lysine exporter protein (LYSE/YGGA) n=1 Tax=Methanococcus vannielii (strain ATCC 35089 / DSM 1224 / JCM 13029 / OCM 148 / SB) TaxID=406327 RepID=A6USN1_METVS|nr:LysE family translocator [Methanococcus vannielii]ABR55503.1 Lysine exporter protein (LYSE/YGGA) [Methanococcus vannielii SB]
MIEYSNLFYFISTSIVLTLLPGPDILFVTVQSISNGKKAGILTAFGLCTGLIMHTIAASVGISAIIYNSALGFSLVKYVGAAYLIYLSINALFEKNGSNFEKTVVKEPVNLYRKGIFMNLLNPKVSLFFLAFLPQFVNSDYGNIPIQMIILGIIFTIQAILIFSAVSILSNAVSLKVFENKKFQKYVCPLKASVFGILGIKLAFFER